MRHSLRFFRAGLAAAFVLMLFAATAMSQEAGRATRRLIILGDSFSTNFGVPKEKTYAALLQKKISAAGLGFYVVDASSAKSTTADGLRDLDFLTREPIDVLFIALGTQDGLQHVPIDDMRHNLLAIIYKVQEKDPRAQIILCGFELPAVLGLDYGARFKALFPEVAKTAGVHLIPLLMEGVADRLDLRQPDELHPNVAGHARMAETVWAHVEPMLKNGPDKDSAAAP